MKDNIKTKDNVKITLQKANGEKIEMSGHNFLTSYGRTVLIDCFVDTPTLNGITNCAVGTGSGQTLADTTLDVELDRKVNDSKTRVGSVMTVNTIFGITDAVGTITELGLFNSNVGAGLIAYIDETELPSLPITKGLGDIMTIEWSLEFN